MAAPAAPKFTVDPYVGMINQYSQANNLDPSLVTSVMQVESGFNPRATSSAGAQGLMQLIPSTQKRFGVTNPYDPEQSIKGGTSYLKFLSDKYAGDRTKIVAAYNAGEDAVDKYGGVPPFDETQNYVRKVLGEGADVRSRGGGAIGGGDMGQLRSDVQDALSVYNANRTPENRAALMRAANQFKAAMGARGQAAPTEGPPDTAGVLAPAGAPAAGKAATPGRAAAEPAPRAAAVSEAQAAKEAFNKDPSEANRARLEKAGRALEGHLTPRQELTVPVDYPNLPFIPRTVVSSLPKKAQIKNYLEKSAYPGSQIMTDEQGRPFLQTKSGQRYRIEGDLWSNIVAQSPELMLGIGGALGAGALAVETGPGAVFAGAVGAGAGAATGTVIKQQARHAMGIEGETPQEEFREVVGSGVAGAASEVGGRALTYGLSRLPVIGERGLPKFLVGEPKVDSEMIRRFRAAGAVPPTTEVFPEWTTIHNRMIVADKLLGRNARVDRANIGYLQDRAGEMMDKAGLPMTERTRDINSMLNPRGRLDTAEAGEQVIQVGSHWNNILSPQTTIRRDVRIQPREGPVTTATTEWPAGRTGPGARLERKTVQRTTVQPEGTKFVTRETEETRSRVSALDRPTQREQIKRDMAAYLGEEGRTPEQALQYILDPRETTRLELFEEMAGRDSPQMRAVRQVAFRDVIMGGFARSESVKAAGAVTMLTGTDLRAASRAALEGEAAERGMTLNQLSSTLGKDMQKALDGYTPRAQEILFPHGLANDIRTVTGELGKLFPDVQDPAAAALHVGAVQQQFFLRRWWHMAVSGGVRALMQNPAILSRLAEGFQGNPFMRARAADTLRGMLFFGALEGMSPGEDPTSWGGQAPGAGAPRRSESLLESARRRRAESGG